MLIPARQAIAMALAQLRAKDMSTAILGLGNLDLSKSDDYNYGVIQHWNHPNPSSYVYGQIQDLLRNTAPKGDVCIDCGGSMEGTPLHCEYAEWDMTREQDAAAVYCGFPG